MNDLNEIRERIDYVDQEMVRLFEERMVLANEVAEFKMKTNKKIFDREREMEKLKKIKSLTSSEFNAKGAVELFSQIMAISRKFQYQKLGELKGSADSFSRITEINKSSCKVAYQGLPGSYSEEAMKTYFGEAVDCVYEKSFRDIMEVLVNGKVEYGVLPIENSTAGIVHEIYDLLVSYDAYIIAEIVIPIQHCLMAKSGAKIEDIRRVYSHPQSILQSAGFLSTFPYIEAIRMDNNAFAAQKIAQEDHMDQAAIASEHAAKIYELEVLKKPVNDIENNSTRFIVVSKNKEYLEQAYKISISFELPNESASLYRALSHIIFNDLNMTKIESRPINHKNWEYRFFVDFEGNLEDASVKNALRGLEEETMDLRILGNYL